MTARPLATRLDGILPTTPLLLVAPPVLQLDEIALLLRERRFVITALGDRFLTAERGVVGNPEEHRELVFCREGAVWYGALYRRRLAEIANEDQVAVAKYARKPQRESGGLLTVDDVMAWLETVLA